MKKEPVTLAMVTPLLKINNLQLRGVRRILSDSGDAFSLDDAASLSHKQLTLILLADLLERMCGFLRPEQKTLILDEVGAEFDVPEMLAFADKAYCTWTGLIGYLNLETGKIALHPAAEPVETIGYNLVTLEQRARNEIAKRQQHADQHHAGSVEEPGDVRVCPPDAVS